MPTTIAIVDLTVSDPSKLRFLPKLLRYMRGRPDVEVIVVREVADIPVRRLGRVSGVVLTGSAMRFTEPLDVNRLAPALFFLANMQHVPILGICFGCQLINVVNGGTVSPVGRTVDGRMRTVRAGGRGRGRQGCERQFWFNDRIDRLGIGLRAIEHVEVGGVSVPCTITKGNLTGVLFHPEAMPEDAARCRVLDDFVRKCERQGPSASAAKP